MNKRFPPSKTAFPTENTGETGAFWASYLARKPEAITLSGKLPGIADCGPSIDVSRHLSADVVAALRDFAERRSVFLDRVLTALVLQYVHKFTDERELLVGVVGRTTQTATTQGGDFSSRIIRPLLVAVDPASSFETLLEKTRREIELVMTQERYSGGDAGLLGTIIDVDSDPVPRRGSVKPASGPILDPILNPILDLAVSIVRDPSSAGMLVTLRANSAHYSRQAVELHADRLVHVLSRDVKSMSGTPVGDIGILSDVEKNTVVREWNETAQDLPQTACAHELFERQAAMFPANIALASKGMSLTYAELNARANRLARYLRQQGVGPEKTVAICVERGTEMILGLLAILKAGGAYVPLDPTFPRERLTYMLKDSAPVACLYHGATEPVVRALGSPVPCLDLDEAGAPWASLSADNIPRQETGALPTNLAYVIYTSGSTGLPKGVAIRGNNLLNYAQFIIRTLSVPPGTKFASVSTIAADLGNTTVFPSLLGGGELHVIDHETATNAKLYEEYMRVNRIDVLKITPSHFKALFDATHASVVIPTNALIFGGERLASSFVDEIHEMKPACRVFNHYGPTECTVGSIMTLVAKDREKTPSIPLGHPIANTQIYILDGEGQPVPIGKVGEIHISGAGVSVGYINRDEETSRRFKPDPFSPNPGQRMYMTGDLGRWLPDGMIEFLGRNDFQVKLRGFRIELGEIESALATCRDVKEAAVIALDEPSGKRLVAYYTSPTEQAHRVLREHLLSTLPEYMVPGQFIRLEAMPLTANGKLDRRALPEPPRQSVANGPGLPATPVERALIDGWTKVIPSLDRDTSLSFVGIGGDSLSYIRVSVAVEKVLGWVPPNWDKMALKDLALLKAQKRQTVTSIDSTILVRAISILLVVLGHFGAIRISGTTIALMLVSGWSFGRYQVASTYNKGSAKPILSTIGRIALPFVLYTGFLQVVLHSPGPASLLMVDNFVSPHYNKGLTAWYVELLGQVMLVMFALFSFKRVRRFAYERQFAFGVAGAVIAYVVAMAVSGPWTTDLYDRVPQRWLWLYLSGIAIAKAPSWWARVGFLAVFAAMSWQIKFAFAPFALIAAAFVILVERVRIWSALDVVVKQIATASLFIYITHFQFGGIPEKLGVRNSVVKSIIAVVGGVCLSLLWDYAYGMVARQWFKLLGRSRAQPQAALGELA
jgi:amino acid adenylation domain-containing protein